ncbi:MAG TPA: metalloregulator ArsR/SmtB family transcription factor [Candidatus Krumholzibacteria bacterium]|nr:metalloregulator ArsR/SmtB family transcription factor [Candidatus Krumholzibacteria bacterium]
MPTPTTDRYAARARVLKAMAHPVRLCLLDALAKDERCVADLQALVGLDMSTVSKHLAVLRGAGLLDADKRGNQVFHRLRTPCVLGFFGCIESVLAAGAARALDVLEPR